MNGFFNWISGLPWLAIWAAIGPVVGAGVSAVWSRRNTLHDERIRIELEREKDQLSLKRDEAAHIREMEKSRVARHASITLERREHIKIALREILQATDEFIDTSQSFNAMRKDYQDGCAEEPDIQECLDAQDAALKRFKLAMIEGQLNLDRFFGRELAEFNAAVFEHADRSIPNLSSEQWRSLLSRIGTARMDLLRRYNQFLNEFENA